ncbi:hypothetical protein H4R18_004692 [Coemansia javaensis]|uniref:Uncharacterized protein n=1 Tax=Coemansia javaensis TaxID=2761396 RepID=A0A9W8LEG4_9FUNG|nr:hypothetical protein H4R18_004692 [Coemansia javaensis]
MAIDVAADAALSAAMVQAVAMVAGSERGECWGLVDRRTGEPLAPDMAVAAHDGAPLTLRRAPPALLQTVPRSMQIT